MKPLLIALLFTVSAEIPSWAEDALMRGGSSPNLHYEVRVSREFGESDIALRREASGYAFHIYRAEKPKPIHTISTTGGHLRYAAALERCQALWHDSSKFVALSDEPARHSREIYIFRVSDQRATRINIPDYVQNALKQVHAKTVDFGCISTPKRWEGDDLILELSFTAHQRISYTCEVTLHLKHRKDAQPQFTVKRVSKPVGTEG